MLSHELQNSLAFDFRYLDFGHIAVFNLSRNFTLQGLQ